MFPSSSAGRPRTSRDRRPWSAALSVACDSRAVGYAALVVVVLMAPFEPIAPLVRLPFQSISFLETVVGVALGAWSLSLAIARRQPRLATPVTMPVALLLGLLAASAAAAPAHRANAAHMVGRLCVAAALGLMTADAVRTPERARRVLAVACVSGVLAALLVLLDYSRWPGAQSWLAPFRTQTATVGAQVRASGSFQYPTIASMFLEVTFAAGAALLPPVVRSASPRTAAALATALVVIAAAITLTYTRAGLVTMLLALSVIGLWRVWRVGLDRGVIALVALAGAVLVMLPLSRSAEAVRLRLSTEQQTGWYRADVDAPAWMTMATGARVPVQVTVTNTGRVTWNSRAPQPFGFSYHWLLADRDQIVSWEGIRTPFPQLVGPGERVTLTAILEAPRQPGKYRVVWDLYQEHLLWFSTEPDAALAVTHATVTGSGTGPAFDVSRLPPMPVPATRPGRALLWQAAIAMVRDRPWLGVGLDNFRLLYGPYARLSRGDPRVHTNNMYLEVVVGGGLLAAGALAWLLWRLGGVILAIWRQADASESATPSAGIVAAAAVIGAHGLVDAFLGFTATYATFGIFAGLLVAEWHEDEVDAHRV